MIRGLGNHTMWHDDISIAGSVCRVMVGRGASAALHTFIPDDATALVVVADPQVAALHGQACLGGVAARDIAVLEWTVPIGESSKGLWQAECFYDYLASKGIDRRALVLALGGGVVGDLAGFVAATWLRGIRWLNCPTTLLAAVDAGIGGKTALNHAGRKNVIGAFHQPEAVVIDTDWLATLNDRQFRSGLAESLKHALVADAAFFEWHAEHAEAIGARDFGVLETLIARNIAIKGAIVQQDERDRSGVRARLNFGHTVGHALEVVSDFQWTHGECVALGMLAAWRVAVERGDIDSATLSRVAAVFEGLGLPTQLPALPDVDPFLTLLHHDKKFMGNQPGFVLPVAVGRVQVGQSVDDDAVLRAVAGLRA